jgi:hypothetical protein
MKQQKELGNRKEKIEKRNLEIGKRVERRGRGTKGRRSEGEKVRRLEDGKDRN